jgi:hypothetical protein
MSASTQRLFHVIVIGGIGLAELAGCGGETSSSTSGAGGAGGAGGTSVGSSGGAAGFPMEGVTVATTTTTTTTAGGGGSSGRDGGGGSGGFAGFPMEGPNPCGTIPPQPQCLDAARDRQAPDAQDGADGALDVQDAAVDVGRDSFPLEGPPPPPNDL